MSVEDTIHITDWGSECVVCGRSLRGGEQYALVPCNGDSEPVCSEPCEKEFHARPRLYVFRHLARQLVEPRRPSPAVVN